MSTPAATVAVRSPKQVPRAPMVVEHSAHEAARRATNCKRGGDLAVVRQKIAGKKVAGKKLPAKNACSGRFWTGKIT